MKLTRIKNESKYDKQLEKLLIWDNDKNLSRFFKSKSKTIEQIKKGLDHKDSYYFMINNLGSDIGYVIFFKTKNKCAYITIAIDKKYWGKGYAQEAISLLEKEGIRAGVKNFKLEVYPENHKALNLYSKLNYKKEGVNEGRIVMSKKLDK